MPIPVLLPHDVGGHETTSDVKYELGIAHQSLTSTLTSTNFHGSILETSSLRYGFPNVIYAKRGPFQFSPHRNPEKMFPFYSDYTKAEGTVDRGTTPLRWTASRNMPFWGAVTSIPKGDKQSCQSKVGKNQQTTSREATAAALSDLNDSYRRIRETGQYTVSSEDRSVAVGFGGLSLLYRQVSHAFPRETLLEKKQEAQLSKTGATPTSRILLASTCLKNLYHIILWWSICL